MSAPLPERLPHRAPFHFISRAQLRDVGSIEAAWRVDGTEAFLRGHFPGRPLVPGVLIGEALAQAAGLVLAAASDAAQGSEGRCVATEGVLAQIELRFRQPVEPPAEIALYASRTGGLGDLHRFDVEARVNALVVAHGTLVLSVRSATASEA